MMTLKGGPAAGVYAVRRAPYWLRAVTSRAGKGDVLDQLDDQPRSGERVHVYRRVGETGWVNVCGRGKGAGRYVIAEYEYLADVDGEALRGTDAWHRWCRERGGEVLRK